MLIDNNAIVFIDRWLDANVSEQYKQQPLAQDWARVVKAFEEKGEAVEALVGMTGQNPRKGYTHSQTDLLAEMADWALTAIFGIQHFTKDIHGTEYILQQRLAYRVEKARIVGQREL